MVKVPAYARYEYVTRKSQQFLIENKVTRFPIDPFHLAEFNDIPVHTYSELSKLRSLSIEDIILKVGSKDGFSAFDDGIFMIFYNDVDHVAQRINFTIMHELGHFYLDHLTEFEIPPRNLINPFKYHSLENEANCFARNVLAPAPLFSKCDQRDIELIASTFNITLKAAKTRLDFLEKDFSNNCLETYRRTEFHILHSEKEEKMMCNLCNNHLNSNYTYCSNCGNNSYRLVRKEDKIMIYSGIEVDSKGKAVICPYCSNSEPNDLGDHCHQCGAYIVNKCSNQKGFNCGTNVLPGNARHCPVCGDMSTFNYFRVLGPYHIERPSIPSLNQYENKPVDVPVHDDDLPF